MIWVGSPRLPKALELVRLGCRFELEPARAREMAHLVASGVDWQQVLGLARWHRVAPILARHLAEAPGVPTEARREFEADRSRTLERFRLASWELGKILMAARSERLAIVVLEGAALAEQLYPDPSLRPMAGLDLLVAEQDSERGEDLLVHLGYGRTEECRAQWYREEQPRYRAERLERRRRARVKLHSHLVRPSSVLHFDSEGLHARAVVAELAGEPTRVLCPADQALHLVLNLFQDSRQRYPSAGALGKLMELMELIARFEEEDVATFDRSVRDYGLSRVSSFILWASERLTGISLPPELCRSLEEPREGSQAFERFFRTKWLRPPSRPWHFHELVEPPDTPTAGKLLCSAVRRVLPHRRRLSVDYGPGTLPRLLWRHGKASASGIASAVLSPADSVSSSRVDLFLGSLMEEGIPAVGANGTS